MAIFYSLPAPLVQPGMSTDDGQDVLEVSFNGDSVLVDVYTPRPDDPDSDAYNRCAPDARIYFSGERIALAVFEDTAVDLSQHPQARDREIR